MKGFPYLIIIGICVVLIILAIIFKKVEWIVNFLLRALLGMVLIYCINSVLFGMGLEHLPGINEVNIASVGLLGMPGIFMIYAIMLYYNVG